MVVGGVERGERVSGVVVGGMMGKMGGVEMEGFGWEMLEGGEKVEGKKEVEKKRKSSRTGLPLFQVELENNPSP